jgi:biotin operon repressor
MHHHGFLDHKSQIYQLLQLNCGSSRTLRAIDIANKFNIDIRAVNDVIRSLRMDGILIGSSKEKPYGYYIPVTEEEIKSYLNTYRNELFDMLQVHNIQKRAARRALEKIRQPEFKIEHDQLAFV